MYESDYKILCAINIKFQIFIISVLYIIKLIRKTLELQFSLIHVTSLIYVKCNLFMKIFLIDELISIVK